MFRYFLSKIFQSILIFFGILLLVFAMVRVTGDPAALMLSRQVSEEEIEAFREKMGFNDPLIVQFGRFISGAVVGDFGSSLHYKTPAMPIVVERMPATVQLAVTGLIMAMVVGIPLGIMGGFKPGSVFDTIGRLVALIGQSVPNFWLALIMILFFAVRLRWFPTFGRGTWKSVIMPAFVLGLPILGRIVRLTRSAVLEIRDEDFILTAHSKGLELNTIYRKHILPNVAILLVSVIGVSFGYMLGGSIYIEAIFAWPGMGGLLEQAVGWRDFPLVQAIAVFTSVVVLGLNLLTDVIYAVVDPRIRYDR